MKKILIAAAICVLPAMSAPVWVRRATLAAACAASATDAVTTWQGKQRGMREANPLFRSSDGSPAMGRVIGLKVGLCAVSAWRQERTTHSNAFLISNILQAILFGGAAWHNETLIK